MTSNSTTAKRPVGTKVGVDHPSYPGVWIVKSNGPVNATLTPEAGGRGLRVPHTMLTEPGAVASPVAPKRIFGLGEFVRVEGKFAGLWVVIKDDGGDRVNVARAGGDDDRYLRISRRGLTPVPASDVLK